MRYLSDPGAIEFGLAAWAYLVVLLLVIPASVIRQHQQQPLPQAGATPMAMYVSGLVTHGVLLVLVFFVVRGESVTIFPAYRLAPWHLAVGAVSLSLALVPFLRHRPMDAAERDQARQVAPRSRKEFAVFYLLSISAGFTEEMAYRGVLFVLLHALTGSFVVAAILGAAVFGVGHLVQGPKAAGIAGLVGIRDHLVVGLTGTLWIAIAVHIIHDAVAGTLLAARVGAGDGVASAPLEANAVS